MEILAKISILFDIMNEITYVKSNKILFTCLDKILFFMVIYFLAY